MELSKNKNCVMDSLVYLMEQAEAVINYTGKPKEAYVLNQLKTLLGNESYERYKPMFPIIIQFLVLISKQKIKLDFNNIKTYCCFK
jgi:hypothetical protein